MFEAAKAPRWEELIGPNTIHRTLYDQISVVDGESNYGGPIVVRKNGRWNGELTVNGTYGEGAELRSRMTSDSSGISYTSFGQIGSAIGARMLRTLNRINKELEDGDSSEIQVIDGVSIRNPVDYRDIIITPMDPASGWVSKTCFINHKSTKENERNELNADYLGKIIGSEYSPILIAKEAAVAGKEESTYVTMRDIHLKKVNASELDVFTKKLLAHKDVVGGVDPNDKNFYLVPDEMGWVINPLVITVARTFNDNWRITDWDKGCDDESAKLVLEKAERWMKTTP